MEFSRTIKDKQVTKRQDDLMKMAEDIISVKDFNNNLFIAYDGTPLVPIEEHWLPQDIIEKLSILRQNYVNSKMKGYAPGFVESIFKMKPTC